MVSIIARRFKSTTFLSFSHPLGDDGPPSYRSVSAMYYHAYNCSIFAYIERCYFHTQQTRDLDAIGGQHQRRCAIVNPTLGQCCNNNDILVNLKVFVKTVLPWALNNAGAGYFMQYIYIYIIMKYVALILLNYDYIIYRSHLPRHLSTGSSSYSACMTT